MSKAKKNEIRIDATTLPKIPETGIRYYGVYGVTFAVIAELNLSEYCEECFSPVKKTGEDWIPVGRSGCAGLEVSIFTCKKCGHKQETKRSRD